MFDIKTSTADYANLILTHNCNKNCAFCVDDKRGELGDMTAETVAKAIRHATENKIKEILLIGGEPTLHPQVIAIAKDLRSRGFVTVLTTNYTKPDIVQQLDGIVDNFNISYYGQKDLEALKDFKSDATIHALVHDKQLETKEKLDAFIGKYQGYGHLKFSTLAPANKFCIENSKNLDYLKDLGATPVVLFEEIEGLLYRGTIIKLHHVPRINENARQSWKYHVNGTISRTW